jgi:uncharacterized membrane protein YfcA
MSAFQVLSLLAIGVLAGVLSGLFGIGGGIVIVPLLIFVAGFTQPQASGTSLVALLLPVGILGVIEYYKSGRIGPPHLKSGIIMAVGLFVGTLLGAKYAADLPVDTLRKGFVVVILLAAAKLWFS